jgi:hypothetical protein
MEATRFASCMRYVCRRLAHCYPARTTPSKTHMDRVAGPSHQGSRQFGGSELLNSYGSGRGQKSSRRHSTDSVALHELRAGAALIISRVQSRSAGRHHTYIRSQTHAVLSSTPCSNLLGAPAIYSCSPCLFSSSIQAKLANPSRYSHTCLKKPARRFLHTRAAWF